MRIGEYWKQAAAGLLTIVTLTMTGGNLGSLAMTNSQPLKAQGQMLSLPDRTIIRDGGDNVQSSRAAVTSQPVIQTRARIAASGEVTAPKTDTTSLFGAGCLTMMVNHDTAAQFLSAIIGTGEGGLVVVDGGWINNAGYFLNQIEQKGDHVQAWLPTHPDLDHMRTLTDILYKHNGGITTNGIYYPFAEDSWYAEKDSEVAKMMACIEGTFDLMSQNILHEDIVPGQIIQADPAKIQVLNQAYKIDNDFINNSSMACVVSLNRTNTMFLRDLAKSDGRQLMANHDLSALRCDIVQMAHHGQNGVGYEVYKALRSSVALWLTSQQLWDNDNGGGSGSGTWLIQETKNWTARLKVNANCCIKDDSQMTE